MLFDLQIETRHVKEECERRILAVYSLGKQNTITLRGGDAAVDMHSFIEAMIAASHRLEAQRPIPIDYRADRHWL